MKVYRIEVKLNKEQIIEYNKTIGVCRFIYNLYISTNIERYNKGLKFLTVYDFSKYLNNEYRVEHPENNWICEVSSKAKSKTILNAYSAFKRFFNKISNFPKFKKKNSRECSFYLIGWGKNNGFTIKRNKIKVPILGWITLKEFGYIPLNSKIKSAVLKRYANKYYISFLTEDVIKNKTNIEYEKYGVGIDLGLEKLASVSDNRFYLNINKTKRVRKIEKGLKRNKRKLSKQLLLKKKYSKNYIKTWRNIDKIKLKIQVLYLRLTNIRNEYIRKTIYSIIKPKNKYVKFVTIEDLNIRGMVKNKHLSKSISDQKFYYFKDFLIQICRKYDIEIREASRFYPSSKICSKCGNIYKDLKLNNRIYKCPKCNNCLDRDLNASINLCNLKEYKMI